MRRARLSLGIGLVAMSSAAALATRQRAEAAPCIALTHVVVINPAADPVRDATVVICGETIEAVSVAARRPPATARIVDEQGRFLIPGLWDMHVHLDQVGETAGPALVAAGVTTVRDAGSPMAVVRRWRERTASGALIAPRIKAAGAIFESPRFIGIIEHFAAEMPPTEGAALRGLMRDRTVVDDAGAIDRAVAAVANTGADFIKVRNVERPEWLYAFAAAAKRRGLPLAAHIIRGVDLARASAAGVRSFEHYEYRGAIDEADIDTQTTLADAFKRNGTALVPTLVTRESLAREPVDAVRLLNERTTIVSAGISDRALELWRMKLALARLDPTPDWRERWDAGAAFVRLAQRRGVAILAGTDLGVPFVYPGTSLTEELEMFVNDLKMTPAESLAAATIGPARWFGIEQSVGTIAPHRRADIVVLGSNPLERIENLRDVRGVVLAGTYYDASALRSVLDR